MVSVRCAENRQNEIKNYKRRRYYTKFQDLALKRQREVFYEMDPWSAKHAIKKFVSDLPI